MQINNHMQKINKLLDKIMQELMLINTKLINNDHMNRLINAV